MNRETKLSWLKRILLVKVVVTFLAWGLPCLFAPSSFLRLFDITMPVDPTFLRLFGAVVTAFGVAYWFAYRDPVRNRAIIQAGIVDNGLVTLTIVYLTLTTGVESWFIHASAVLTGLFCISFILFMPPRKRQKPIRPAVASHIVFKRIGKAMEPVWFAVP